MFNDTKYTAWYYSIILSSKTRVVNRKDEYYEEHHIIPKKLGGSNARDNLVYLTAREHFLCHWLLTKMCDTKEHQLRMHRAFWCMSRSSKNHVRKVTSAQYEVAKKHASLAMKLQHQLYPRDHRGSKNPMYGKRQSEASKMLIRNACSLQVFTEEHKENIRKGMLGKNTGTSNGMFGKPSQYRGKKRPPEQCVNMRKPKQRVICPHCGKEGGMNAMNRYHFNNCKHS